jgi:hypothetical protein
MKKKTLWFLVIVAVALIPGLVGSTTYKVGDAPVVLDQAVDRTGVEKTDIATMVGTVIRVGLSLVGVAFFVTMIYTGFRWMTARGNDELVTKARNSLIAATIGFVIVISAYAITAFVTRGVLEGVDYSTRTNDSMGGNAEESDRNPLGCCLDQYETPGGTFGGSQSGWSPSITTQSLCERAGNRPPLDDMSGDQKYGPGTWEFYPGVAASECEERRVN